MEDFKFLYEHGINTVRIPVGWWIACDPDPPNPFIGGSLEALDNAFSWAQEYDIKCIIDLHAAPGSQNGMEHSASIDGFTDWPTSPDYISKSLPVIEFLFSRYATHSALLGIELLNEPSAATRIGNADPLELYQANIGSTNLVLDLHFYNLFDKSFVNMSAGDNVQYIYKSREGEWVNEWNVANGSQTDYENFGKAQLDVYNAASFGWCYWTLKNDMKHWDFEWNIRNNYLQLGNSTSKKSISTLGLFGLA
ncbi:hypothetical protein TSUD_180240 [Trifolium subterraneum]|nr:hypothetical protein TSUD_180240 [Trifolium subterraneum]